jgi:transposase InsO family protein
VHDFKGHFSVGTTHCHPLTATDAVSRFIIACVALTSTTTTAARRALERVFAEFGLPDADNGSPFASVALRGSRGCRFGGGAWASATSASNPGSRSRTAGTSGCT